MILYHGSDVLIECVDLKHSLMYKDFGPGFYVSDGLIQAKNFAKYKADKPSSKTHTPIVTAFEFDEKLLINGILHIKQFENYSSEWVDFIHAHRGKKDTDYDLIIGPIANDDVRTKFAQYEMGEISKEELLESLKYKKVTFQYCFKTELSIATLKRIEL